MNPRSVLLAIQNISYAHDTRMQLIARSLHAAGYEVHVVCPRSEDEAPRQVHDGVHVWTFRMPSERLRLGGLVVEYLYSAVVMTVLVMRLCLRCGIGVVHVCLPPPVLQPLCAVLRRLGRTTVVDVHDLAPELFELRYPGRSWLARLVRRAERWAVRAADHVIVTNESGASVVRGRCGVPAERVTVVRTGPDLDELPERPRSNGRHEVLVGYVGNVAPQDGVENLVRAAGNVVGSRGRRDIRFLCIGAGSDLPRARELAEELGLDGGLEFTGRLPHDAALERLAACDICVQPDGKNAFTDSCTMIKTLEYMGLAKPVVAFDLVETRVSCGQSALYARGDSPERLADLVVALADDPGLRRLLGSEGRRRVEAQLAWQHWERRLLALYDHLTGSGEHVQRLAVEPVRDPHPSRPEERRRKVHQV